MNAHQRRVSLRSKWDMKAINALPRFTFDLEANFFTGGVYRPLNDFLIVGQQASDQGEVVDVFKVLKERPAVPVALEIDFTALEDRIIAYGGGKGIDCHRLKAAAMFDVAYEDVTPEQRAKGKDANYLDRYKP